MSFYKTWRFWESVVASAVAAALLWLLGQLLKPVRATVIGMGWDGFVEWFANLGWFLFVMTLAIWFVNRRGLHQTEATIAPPAAASTTPPPIPKLEVTTTGYPIRVDPSSSTTLIAWKNRYVPEEGGRVDLVKGSIHVELWNSSGKGRTGRTRLIRFT